MKKQGNTMKRIISGLLVAVLVFTFAGDIFAYALETTDSDVTVVKEELNDGEENPDTEEPNNGEENPDTEEPNNGEENPDTEEPNDGEENPDTEEPNDGEENPDTEEPNGGENILEPEEMPENSALFDTMPVSVSSYEELRTAIADASSGDTIIISDNITKLTDEEPILIDKDIILSGDNVTIITEDSSLTYLNEEKMKSQRHFIIEGDEINFTLNSVDLIGGNNSGGIDSTATNLIFTGNVKDCKWDKVGKGYDKGGGIKALGFTFVDGEISGNTFPVVGDYSYGALGGGVYIDVDGFMIMENGKIINNKAGHGGGVSCAGSNQLTEQPTFQLINGSIDNNEAINGGGLHFGDFGNNFLKDVSLQGGTVSSNKATTGGGVWYTSLSSVSADNGKLEIAGVSINDNTTKGDGAGISAVGNVEMSSGKINNNVVEYASTIGGGGIALECYLEGDKTSFLMTGGEITGNKGKSGGGISAISYIHMDQPIIEINLLGGEISENTATSSGGGIYGFYTKTTIGDEMIISKNTGKSGGGAAFLGSEFIMNGGTITENISQTTGGGLLVSDGYRWGAVSGDHNLYILPSSFIMNDGIISKNKATNDEKTGKGGGLVLRTSETTEINGGEITDNTADSIGGGIYIYPAVITTSLASEPIGVTLNGGTINGNSAELGGGMYLQNHKTVDDKKVAYIDNSLVTIPADSTVVFSEGNTANAKRNTATGAYKITDSEKALHETQILKTDYITSLDEEGIKPYPYLFNNYDIATYKTGEEDYEVEIGIVNYNLIGGSINGESSFTTKYWVGIEDNITTEIPVKAGNKFINWKETDSSTIYESNDEFVTDLTQINLEAVWETVAAPKYDIKVNHWTYSSNIADAKLYESKSYPVEEGESFTASKLNIKDYTFDSKNSDALIIGEVTKEGEINLYYKENTTVKPNPDRPSTGGTDVPDNVYPKSDKLISSYLGAVKENLAPTTSLPLTGGMLLATQGGTSQTIAALGVVLSTALAGLIYSNKKRK